MWYDSNKQINTFKGVKLSNDKAAVSVDQYKCFIDVICYIARIPSERMGIVMAYTRTYVYHRGYFSLHM